MAVDDAAPRPCHVGAALVDDLAADRADLSCPRIGSEIATYPDGCFFLGDAAATRSLPPSMEAVAQTGAEAFSLADSPTDDGRGGRMPREAGTP